MLHPTLSVSISDRLFCTLAFTCNPALSTFGGAENSVAESSARCNEKKKLTVNLFPLCVCDNYNLLFKQTIKTKLLAAIQDDNLCNYNNKQNYLKYTHYTNTLISLFRVKQERASNLMISFSIFYKKILYLKICYNNFLKYVNKLQWIFTYKNFMQKINREVKVNFTSVGKPIGIYIRILLWQWHIFRQDLTKSWIGRIYNVWRSAKIYLGLTSAFSVII